MIIKNPFKPNIFSLLVVLSMTDPTWVSQTVVLGLGIAIILHQGM